MSHTPSPAPGPARSERFGTARHHPYAPPITRSFPAGSQNSFLTSYDENTHPDSPFHGPLDSIGNVNPSRDHYTTASGAEYGSFPGGNHSGYPILRCAPQSVDAIVDKFEIPQHRNTLQQFSQAPHEDQNTMIYGMLLKLTDEVQALREEQRVAKVKIERTEALAEQGWSPSKSHKILLKTMLGHFMVKPLETYERIPRSVGLCVLRKPTLFRLALYSIDATSAFRKIIMESITKMQPLADLGRRVVQRFHMPKVPNPVPQDMLAAYALLRKVAVSKATELRYWPLVEKELTQLYQQLGSNRQGEAWCTWEKEIIEADNKLYDHAGPQASASTHAEVHFALEEADVIDNPGDREDTQPVPEANGSGINFNLILTRSETRLLHYTRDELDGEVDINSLGNIASVLEEFVEN
ncbi:hypothetical protein B0H21DRAFT_818892 [Amylocystis lapponica]|nr:hypothetical protein B0H21DRAFT_818892 [Amylocystis lapponica]